MSDIFRNSLGPALWALPLVPLAILALYFLRLKRQPVEVPSTYLWTKAIEDFHVNSLWQRFRRNLLLWLQLLAVCLAILALWRPGWRGQTLAGKKFIFLVDRSASMATTDVEGQSRLDAAKQQLDGLIDQLESDMSAMIIAFDDQPSVVQQFTDNHRRLHEAVARLRTVPRRTDVRGALNLAGSYANPNRVTIEEGGAEVDAAPPEDVELYVLSDGRFAAADDFSVGNLRPRFLPLGTSTTSNLALTALSVARNPVQPERRQAFVQAANFGAAAAAVVIELHRDGSLVDARELTIEPGDAGNATFDLDAALAGGLEARLAAADSQRNQLAIDDRAYAALDPARLAKVMLVTPGNRALELGLATASVRRLATVERCRPEEAASPQFVRRVQSEGYDLVIYDQTAPESAEAMPAANTLLVGRLPPLASWRERSSEKPMAGPQIIDWERSHPLLALVELGSVAVVDSYVVQPPSGGTVLVDSTVGPIFAIAPRGSYEDAVLGFELVGRNDAGETTINTNWPRTHGFPNFCLNVAEYLAGAGAARGVTIQAGEPAELDLPSADGSYRVRAPDGSLRDVTRAPTGPTMFAGADQLGVYQVERDGEVVTRFAVNLLDRQESDVALRTRQDGPTGPMTVASLTLGNTEIAASSREPVRRELWTAVLGAALAALTAEWYIYTRRAAA